MNRVPQTPLGLLAGDERSARIKRSLWISLLLFFAVSASALEVQEIRWGFDGQVVPGRFNPLSVLVANNSAAPFDGSITFYKSRGLDERVGALYVTPCYLSPLAERWVQFYVYIDNQYDQWRLEWGRGPNNRHDLDAPKWGVPAQILLSDEMTRSAASAFRQFPDELFPPTMAATGGLESLLLDHAPRWEPAKRRAFLDWLRAGGKAHVLMGSDGRYPIFSDELAVLNLTEDRTRIGAGLAVRHAATAAQIQKQDIDPGDTGKKPKAEDSNEVYQITNTLFSALSRLSRTRLDWGLIYLLAIVYLGLVGPGNFLAGKRLADYRLRILVLLGTVAGFALLFNFVGRRGQGETSTVHTLSYARAIDGNTYDVLQWINVFATRGGHYTITHAAPHNIYSTGQDYESVNGWIDSGKDGQFTVDLPMFSHRGLLHEAEMKGTDLGVKIIDWQGAQTLKKLTLSAQPDFAKQIIEGWLVQGDQVYAMNVVDGHLEFSESSKKFLNEALSPSNPQQNPYAYGNPYEDKVTDAEVEKQFQQLVKPLMAWSLGVNTAKTATVSPLAADNAVQLFLFAHSPQSFSVAGKQFSREIGYVLYRLDLFKPGL